MTVGADAHDSNVQPIAPSQPEHFARNHARVEWLPAALDRVRVTRIVAVPLSEVEEALRIGPERIANVVYKSGAYAPDGGTVVLTAGRSWLRVPARIDFLTPTGHPAASISLRWRASRLAQYFPILEADVLVRGFDGATELTLEGTYRPPLGLIGLIFDRLVGRWFATTTVERFVDGLATSLETAEL